MARTKTGAAGRKGKGVFASRDFADGEVVMPYKKGAMIDSASLARVWRGRWKYIDKVGEDKFMVMRPPRAVHQQLVPAKCLRP